MDLTKAILICGVGGVILGVYGAYMYGILVENGVVYPGDLMNGGFWAGVIGVIVGAVYPRAGAKTETHAQ